MNPEPHIWNLMTRKLTGQLTLKQEQELQSWLLANTQGMALWKQVVRIWDQSTVGPDIPESSTEKRWETLAGKLDDQLIERQHKTDLAPRSIAWKRNLSWLAVAGTISVLIMAGAYKISTLTPNQPAISETVEQEKQPSAQPGIYQPLAFRITQDSLENFKLPDGSKVWLNKNSTLHYGNTFNRTIREVILEGEAFFEVKPDADRPFIIQAGPSETRVLGTSFNLKAYRHEDPEVTVLKGSVTFSNQTGPGKGVLLKEGEKGAIDVREGSVVKKLNNNPHFLDWKYALDYRQEISAPAEFLTGQFQKKKSAINQTEIDGIIYNHATLATFKNVKLRVQYFNKKKEKIKSHVFTVYQSIGPGESIDYRYRLADWFSQTDQLQIKVVDATVSKN